MEYGSMEWIYADDDISALKMFSDAVNGISQSRIAKINLTTFRTGEEVIATLKSKKAKDCMVFLDIDIPAKNGFQVLRELKANKDLKDVPVIMHSTSKGRVSIDISSELGADLYIIKPDSAVELQELLKKVITFDFRGSKLIGDDFVLNS